MAAVIRKLLRIDESQLIEGEPAFVPPRLMAAAAVVRDRRPLSGFEGTRP
jgi:hypothetical protein